MSSPTLPSPPTQQRDIPRRRADLSTAVRVGFQQEINTARGLEYVAVQDYRQVHTMWFVIATFVVCIIVWLVLQLRLVQIRYKTFIEFIDTSGWTRSSGLNVALCCAWSWYNFFFCPGNNTKFPNALLAALSNQVLIDDIKKNPKDAIERIFTEAQNHTSTDNTTPLDIVCVGLGFNHSSSSPEAKACWQPCPSVNQYATSTTQAMVSGGATGAMGGAMALAVAGPYGLAAGALVGGALGGFISKGENDTKRKNDAAACYNSQLGHCYIPPGSCSSNLS